MKTGYNGRILFVDLTSGEINEEHLDGKLYRKFIGGVGLGAGLLYQYQPGGADPMGEDNILGFMPGLLGGTIVPGSPRLTVVAKSPLTGTWGDASVGGHIAAAIKRCGFDGILFRGISPRPAYLLVSNGKVELRDATHLWGKDTVETQATLHREVGDRRLRIACIGPAGEARSLIAAIFTAEIEGRAAARSGLGAVMGSKRLKAIAVDGQNDVPVADEKLLKELRREFVDSVKNAAVPYITNLKNGGTAIVTGSFIAGGATPFKNWTMIGPESMPDYEPYDDRINRHTVRRLACTSCPVGCGGILKSDEIGDGEFDRPEYETIAAFGPMCMNTDAIAIIKADDICNRYGIDTISTGNAVAFAMECYEHGIITREDTGGIELKWGDPEAILSLVTKIARREGFGAVLADGVAKAARQIGKGSEEYAMHVGGQELGYHEPRQLPSRGVGYICDPTPGRHTSFLIGRLFEGGPLPGPYPGFFGPELEIRDYAHKHLIWGNCVKYERVIDSAGICAFICFQPGFKLIEFIRAVTGWDFDLEELRTTGERIQNIRHLFNLREGIDPKQFRLPSRLTQPAAMGPYKGAPQDFDLLRRQYYKAMGWDEETGLPQATRLKELGLPCLPEGG